MKIVLSIVGVLLTLMGIVWTLQGFNILPGSFMSGRIQYAVLGIIVGIGGILLLVFANRRRRLDTGDKGHQIKLTSHAQKLNFSNYQKASLSEQEFQELLIGTNAPDFKLAAGTGKEISLSDYQGKSHVVLFFIREFE